MPEMGIYETMRTLRAVRRLGLIRSPMTCCIACSRQRPGRRPAETCSPGG